MLEGDPVDERQSVLATKRRCGGSTPRLGRGPARRLRQELKVKYEPEALVLDNNRVTASAERPGRE